MEIRDDQLNLEIIIVDDCSTDGSFDIAKRLAEKYEELFILQHDVNQGKGAALQTGFANATGDFVAVQDADLEYNPMDLKRLVEPLANDEADVVLGSRFLTGEAHRVLYFWHSLGNKFLTFLSNMFSDLNLTDMECCYKLFKREIIQSISLQEKRFGIEPELVAKVAQMRVRIFEMGVSYAARTYEEGKKIGIRDGLRALYCIFHYNLPKAAIPIQFMIYTLIGGFSAVANLCLFLLLIHLGVTRNLAIPISFFTAAGINYFLCISFLFRHQARWTLAGEMLAYLLVVCLIGLMDFGITNFMIRLNYPVAVSKAFASASGFLLNFFGRRFFVFSEPPAGRWRPQRDASKFQ